MNSTLPANSAPENAPHSSDNPSQDKFPGGSLHEDLAHAQSRKPGEAASLDDIARLLQAAGPEKLRELVAKLIADGTIKDPAEMKDIRTLMLALGANSTVLAAQCAHALRQIIFLHILERVQSKISSTSRVISHFQSNEPPKTCLDTPTAQQEYISHGIAEPENHIPGEAEVIQKALEQIGEDRKHEEKERTEKDLREEEEHRRIVERFQSQIEVFLEQFPELRDSPAVSQLVLGPGPTFMTYIPRQRLEELRDEHLAAAKKAAA